MKKAQKFLQFNGKEILVYCENGVWWIALKSISEALNVNYKAQYDNVTQDPILGPASTVQGIQVPGDQMRKYYCIPERYIYGYIFSIRSDSKELLEYKQKCYDVLYEFFHGTITRRKEVLEQALLDSTRADEIRTLLANNDLVNELNDCEGRILRAGKELKKLDSELLDSIQLNLFQQKN